MCGHMVDMVTLRPGRGHNGGVGDGGAVVAAHRARHTGGDADDGQGLAHGEHALDDGDEDAEGAPGGSSGKGQQAAHREYDNGQQNLNAGGGAHKVAHKIFRAQGVGHPLQRPSKGENHDGGHHGFKALRDAAHHLFKGHGPAKYVVHQGEHQTECGAQHKAHRGVGVREGGDKVLPGEKTAGVDHTHHTAHHQHRDGQHQIQHGTLGFIHLLVHHGVRVGPGEQIAVFHRIFFVFGHGAEVHIEHYQPYHHHKGEQGVEVVRNGADEQVQPLSVLGKGGHGSGPGGDRRYNADRRGGGIDEVGQLGPGNTMLIGNGPHDAAHGEAVEIVVNEDEAPQHNGGQLGPRPGLDIFLGPASKGGGASRLVHQAHDGPQNNQEDEDAHVVAVRQGGHDAVLEGMEHRTFKAEVGVQQTSHQNADEQGGVDLFGDERQGNGNDRGQQGPRGVVIPAGGVDIAAPLTALAGGGHPCVGQNHAQGAAVGALNHFGASLLRRICGGGKGSGSQGKDHQNQQRDESQAVSSRSH